MEMNYEVSIEKKFYEDGWPINDAEMNNLIDWCEEVIGKELCKIVCEFSDRPYRVIFYDGKDAIAFRLKFGL